MWHPICIAFQKMSLSKLKMIKFVYFDVGGVVIKDFSQRPELRRELWGETGITEEYWARNCDGKLDLGQIPNNLPVTYSKLLSGFVSSFEKNPSIWPIIESVKKKAKIGLLTNMYPKMLASIKKNDLLPSINWDVTIDSVAEKARKPERKIFEIAQERSGVKPEEILFVENTPKNLEAPKMLGWQTFFYDSSNYERSSEQLKTYFSQIDLF